MTGISEILVLVLLIACILILPRLFKGEPSKDAASLSSVHKLSKKHRLYIVLSIIYPITAALYLRPSKENFFTYLLIGVIPVVLVWAIVWVLAGHKK